MIFISLISESLCNWSPWPLVATWGKNDLAAIRWKISSQKQMNHVKISRMKSQINGQWSHKFENVSTIEEKKFTTQLAWLVIQTSHTFSSSSITIVLFNEQSSFIPGAYFAATLGAAKSVFPKLATRDSHIVWWLYNHIEQCTIFCFQRTKWCGFLVT